jgi:hypothetical protein
LTTHFLFTWVWTVDFRSRVFTRTSHDIWHLRQRSSHDVGIFANENNRAKKKDVWVSRIINWMCSSSFEDEMCSHLWV